MVLGVGCKDCEGLLRVGIRIGDRAKFSLRVRRSSRAKGRVRIRYTAKFRFAPMLKVRKRDRA